MSIATQISALQADKTAIANAITDKGGTVNSGDGFDDFATDIGTIPTGGGIGDKLAEVDLGTIQVTATSATDLSKTATVNGVYGYDVILVVIRRASKQGGYHWQTLTEINLTENSAEGTTSNQAVVTSKQNKRYTTGGATLTYCSTTAYGIYVNSVSRSTSKLTLTLYGRYNANYTLTINGSYTLYAYGLKLR